ncbi:hypothetical protein RIF29_25529 [Crotalaria pallida]|uniref:Uncharacterized protein n=1 Tax=Crotalaria pallida TaxID=3830 RepID=A0AAN9HZW0_CROPI
MKEKEKEKGSNSSNSVEERYTIWESVIHLYMFSMTTGSLTTTSFGFLFLVGVFELLLFFNLFGLCQLPTATACCLLLPAAAYPMA